VRNTTSSKTIFSLREFKSLPLRKALNPPDKATRRSFLPHPRGLGHCGKNPRDSKGLSELLHIKQALEKMQEHQGA